MSYNNPDEPAAEIFRPPVPPPTASSTSVRAFLVQFFRALNCDRTLSEAKEMAAKLNVDGIALYELPEKKFLDEFEYEGKTIYDALQRSKYGYDSNYWPKLKMVGGTLGIVASLEGLLEFWKKQESRNFIFPLVYTIVIILFAVLNLSCRSQAAIDSEWLPEGFKIRRGA